ncbi:MAG: hypothetical protein AAGF12_41915 [Myxococcota bacterium]
MGGRVSVIVGLVLWIGAAPSLAEAQLFASRVVDREVVENAEDLTRPRIRLRRQPRPQQGAPAGFRYEDRIDSKLLAAGIIASVAGYAVGAAMGGALLDEDGNETAGYLSFVPVAGSFLSAGLTDCERTRVPNLCGIRTVGTVVTGLAQAVGIVLTVIASHARPTLVRDRRQIEYDLSIAATPGGGSASLRFRF